MAETEFCPTGGCPGDARYAAPGRGHAPGCHYPLAAFGGESLAAECPCGCPDDMHIGEIGCPCGMPDEPPCLAAPASRDAQ